MEPKKNPKADLKRKSVLFLQLGLVLVLLITWRAIEWKTYDKEAIDTGQLSMDDLDDEEIPITEMQNTPPPPPPPPPAPEIIEVVEDEEEVEEDEIESTETNLEEIVEVEEVVEAPVEEEVADVPFAVIEDVPIFPGCENLKNNEERKQCMSKKISQFVNRNFDTDLGAELGLSGVNRVIVQFKIDEKGNITNVMSRAPHPRLEREAARVINKLPKMQPGKQRGKAVGVMYSLPIVFQVQD
ncbi:MULTISPECIES: energy transducer TonB [Salegentibacter]|uniref:Energy transducer TonB n=1 Tax=Salegentibacter maritimus TaxID=2794347 RepID=A0ABS0TGV5_9FLAO|nr:MULTISPECIES: energy transducer TonB [Salegentibacter]MBE7640731.1 energy transducer TonB [Salegentibacter sp. BLCTC]MBI6115435.1 energy transducer TonB [Salegentibacter maritimus]MBI6119259.1 energy transducer TonB [Salegentibacter maritimus]